MALPDGRAGDFGRWAARRLSAALVALVALAAWVVSAVVAVAAPVESAPSRTRDHLWMPGVYDPAKGWVGRAARAFEDRKARYAAAGPKEPSAVLPLLGLVDALHGEIDEASISAFLRTVAQSSHVHPLVRGVAAYEAAILDERRGRIDASAAALRRLGFVLDWVFVGPFDFRGPSDLDGGHPCLDEPYRSDAVFEGAVVGEPLAWRAYDYDGFADGGFVGFDELLTPNEKVFACATTWIHVPRDGDVAVRVGTGGAYRVFVGKDEVLRGDDRRLPHPLQDAATVRLSSGWHRLHVLVANESEPWGFYLRVTRPDGTPLSGLEVRAEPPKTSVRGRSAPARRPANTLRGLLERRASGGDPVKELDLCEFEWRTHPYARSDSRTVDRLRRIEPSLERARASFLRSLVETDESARRLALERAIELGKKEGLGPRLGPWLLELAFRERSLGLERAARARLQEAFDVAPDDAAIELVLIDEFADAGFEAQALEWSLDLLGRRSASASVRDAVAERLAAAGRKAEALDVLTDGGVITQVGRNRIVNWSLELGRVDVAVAAARRDASMFPGRPGVFRRLAWVLDAAGRERDAWDAMARALQLAPLDPELHAEAARLALLHGRATVAVAELRRSLDLRPQQPDLRTLLSSLDGGADRDIFERRALDLERVVRRKTPPKWQRRPAVTLARTVAVRVHDNGLSERLDHRILRIQDERGVRDRNVHSFFHDPSQSYVEVRRARVRHPDGTVEEMGRVRVSSLAEAGYRMYYDRRRVDVIFDRLEPGDVIEVAFVERDVAARNMFDTYFGDLQPIGGIDPIGRFEYLVEAPDSMPLFFRHGDVREERRAGRRIYRLVRTDVPHIDPEPRMPGWTDVADYVHVSSYADWDEVARWYWRLVREQLVVDERIRAAAARAVEGIPVEDRRARMEAIYTYVVRNTRYVGLEFGIHGYKPYPTTEVFARRYGDCKDKAALLKVMLEQVGIDSHMVLVRTRDLGGIDPHPASLAAFNHAIVFVPEFDVYLDGTAEWSGPSELPELDRGATVLHVLDGAGGRLVRIPMSSPDENETRIVGSVRLTRQGAGAGRIELHVRGVEAATMRRAFQAAERRRERAAAMLGELFGSVDVRSVDAGDIDDIRRPVTLDVEVRLPALATAEGSSLRLPVLGHRLALTRVWAPKGARRHPLEVGVPTTIVRRMEFVAPPGYRFAEVPEGGRIVHEAVASTLEVRTEDGGTRAVVESRIRFLRDRIPPETFGSFRATLQRVDALHGQSFVLERKR